MTTAVIVVFSCCILAMIGTRTYQRAPKGPIRSALMAQVVLLLLYVFGRHAATGALAATFGIVIIEYIRSGRIRRSVHFFALLALVPQWGDVIAAQMWLAIPWIAQRTKRSAIRDPESLVMSETIFIGTLAAGLFTSIVSFSGTEALALGPVLATLFLYAGLHALRDQENEFSFPEVSNFVRNGLFFLIPCALLPDLLFAGNAIIFERFFISAGAAAALIFIAVLVSHFESIGIRTFLVLFGISLVPVGAIALYSERLDISTIVTFRLISLITLILSSLFMLKQYLQWGFEIVRTMLMTITAIAAATVAFIIAQLMHPATVDLDLADPERLILLLDLAILASLPPLLINYSAGTMKVTWAILSCGIFFTVFADLAGKYSLKSLGVALIALAFATLWRYTNAMISRIRTISARLEV